MQPASRSWRASSPAISVAASDSNASYYLEECGAVETVCNEYLKTLGKEMALYVSLGCSHLHERGIGELLHHEHAGIHTLFAERLHKAPAHYGSSPGGIAFVDYHDFHGFMALSRVTYLYLTSSVDSHPLSSTLRHSAPSRG